MLRKFAVSNFRGFENRIELVLDSPSNFEYNGFAVHEGILKDVMIYGPNGSGKSNIGFALFDIVNHLTQKNKIPDYYSNYTFGRNGLPVSFEYVFQLSGKTLEYDYSKAADGSLISEKLVVSGITYFDRGVHSVYFNPDFFSVLPSLSDDILRSANSVSLISYLMSSYPLSEGSPLILLNEFVNGMLWFRCLEERRYIGFENGTTYLEEYIISTGKVDDFKEFIRKVSGQDFLFKTPRPGDKFLYCVVNGKELLFNEISSTGTHSLTLLYYWLSKMSTASLVFIDEFDAFYHYELSYEVCKRLFSLNAQVVLTTHNTSLMTNDLLRPDCYFLINGKEVKPLTKCTDKELRVGHNLEKLYRGNGFHI